MYYRHRDYDSKIGRFLARDPIGYNAGPSLYQYVCSNPTNLCDPLGLDEAPADAWKIKSQAGTYFKIPDDADWKPEDITMNDLQIGGGHRLMGPIILGKKYTVTWYGEWKDVPGSRKFIWCEIIADEPGEVPTAAVLNMSNAHRRKCVDCVRYETWTQERTKYIVQYTRFREQKPGHYGGEIGKRSPASYFTGSWEIWRGPATPMEAGKETRPQARRLPGTSECELSTLAASQACVDATEAAANTKAGATGAGAK